MQVGDAPIVTQSNACFYHLGRVLNMNGDSVVEEDYNLQLLCECYDLRNHMVRIAYSRGDEKGEVLNVLRGPASDIYHKLEHWLHDKAALS